jgi:hypothetical protein
MIMEYHIGWKINYFILFLFYLKDLWIKYLSISNHTVHKDVDSHAGIQKDEDVLLDIRGGQGTFTIKVVVLIFD